MQKEKLPFSAGHGAGLEMIILCASTSSQLQYRASVFLHVCTKGIYGSIVLLMKWIGKSLGNRARLGERGSCLIGTTKGLSN